MKSSGEMWEKVQFFSQISKGTGCDQNSWKHDFFCCKMEMLHTERQKKKKKIASV